MKRTIIIVALLTIIGLLPSSARQTSAQTTRPNILFLISDDHSAESLGCYGNPQVRTPHLDRLAAEGMRFANAFVTSPQCSPSRSSLITGQYAHTIGTARLHTPLRPPHQHVVGLLKAAGYFTGVYRKHHLGDDFQKELDFYADKESFTAFFARRPKDKPFFLQIGFRDPHRPYKPGAVTPPHNPAQVRVPAFLPDTPETRSEIALYYDAIARMDGEVGELLGLLREHGVAENTLVVFTADNGMPFTGAKGSLYDAGLRVPLIARWPGRIKAGQTSDALISLVDLAPTWLQAAAVSVPATVAGLMQGRSFLNLLLGGSYQERTAIYAERNWHDVLDLVRCVRTPQYKLIQNYRSEVAYEPQGAIGAVKSPAWDALVNLHQTGKLSAALARRYFQAPRPAIEFYDLKNDPDELNNLAADPAQAAAVRQLQELLSRWMQETNDFLPPPFGAIPGRAGQQALPGGKP